MSTAVIVIIVVLALIVGLVVSLRRSAKTGMPSQDVLERASRRARQLDTEEKDDGRGN